MKAIRSFVTEQILLVKNSVNDTVRENCPSAELFLARLQSEYRKIRTRSNSVFGHFSRNVFTECSLQNTPVMTFTSLDCNDYKYTV